jgi:Family of unknown function (DUF6194)
VIDPAEILSRLTAVDPGVRQEAYYGERSLFFNPGRERPLGVIFASIKDRDGPNDKAANLSRPGVYRFAFGLTRETYADIFEAVPARPPKGEAVTLRGHDLTATGELTPHPVYAWMSWVQILNPTTDRIDSLRGLLTSSLDLARYKWRRRRG